jgi:2'-5' RNA ligase
VKAEEATSVPQPDESALVVLVPEAEPLVGPTRIQFDRSAMRGMPAYITVLYPFRHPDDLSSELMEELGSVFARVSRFKFRLSGLCGFHGVIYLAPEPFEPFDALTREIATRFPDTPPYRGAFANPVPHLTVAQKPPAPSLTEVTFEFLNSAGPRLPLDCIATGASLAVKRAGQWHVGRCFAFA